MPRLKDLYRTRTKLTQRQARGIAQTTKELPLQGYGSRHPIHVLTCGSHAPAPFDYKGFEYGDKFFPSIGTITRPMTITEVYTWWDEHRGNAP